MFSFTMKTLTVNCMSFTPTGKRWMFVNLSRWMPERTAGKKTAELLRALRFFYNSRLFYVPVYDLNTWLCYDQNKSNCSIKIQEKQMPYPKLNKSLIVTLLPALIWGLSACGGAEESE